MQVDHEKTQAGIGAFVTRHDYLQNLLFRLTLIFGFVHGTMRGCLDFFYSLVRRLMYLRPN